MREEYGTLCVRQGRRGEVTEGAAEVLVRRPVALLAGFGAVVGLATGGTDFGCGSGADGADRVEVVRHVGQDSRVGRNFGDWLRW